MNGEKITHSVIISSARRAHRLGRWTASRTWAPSISRNWRWLDAEVVIFGSGTRIRFPHAAWLQPLMARRIGVETMDTAAACRTYNILAQEGRNVAVALLLEQPV